MSIINDSSSIFVIKKLSKNDHRREVWQYLLGHLDWTDSVEEIQMRESRQHSFSFPPFLTISLPPSHHHRSVIRFKMNEIIIIFIFSITIIIIPRLQSEYEAQLSSSFMIIIITTFVIITIITINIIIANITLTVRGCSYIT